MDFKSKTSEFLKKQSKNKQLTVNNIEHLESLIDDLNFKYDAINYHLQRINETKKELADLAKERIKINQKKISQFDTPYEKTIEKLKKGIKGKTSFSTKKVSISYSEEVDSNKLFFEFESLMFSISSFIDYSFKVLKIFFPKIKTSKSKIIKSIAKNYPQAELKKYIEEQFDSWIKELLNYRDHIVHLSPLNLNIVVKVSNNPVWGNISKNDGKFTASISMVSNAPEIQPIYLPFEPDYKYKIVEKIKRHKINYEDDFYIFEDYLKKLMEFFRNYSLNIWDEINK